MPARGRVDPMSGEATIVHCDDALCIMTWRDFFLYAWTGRGNAGHAQSLLDCHRRYLKDNKSKTTVAMAHIKGPAMIIPDEATRETLREHVRVARDVRAFATVIDGDGFGAAMIRGLVSSLSLLSRRELVREVHRTPRDGLAFLLRERDPSHEPVTLDDVVRVYETAIAS